MDDISDCLHLYAFCFVDVFKRIEFFGLFVLNDANLDEIERVLVLVNKVDCTLPKAPFPTLLSSRKWNRLTSPSKSIGCIGQMRCEGVWRIVAYIGFTADAAHGLGLAPSRPVAGILDIIRKRLKECRRERIEKEEGGRGD